MYNKVKQLLSDYMNHVHQCTNDYFDSLARYISGKDTY